MSFNIAALHAQMSDEEFELLLRLRLQAAFDALPSKHRIFLFAHTDFGKSTLKNAEWHVGPTDVSADTIGEILGRCVNEAIRRQEFRQSCQLRMIEAEP
jgi:hypothetical protein